MRGTFATICMSIVLPVAAGNGVYRICDEDAWQMVEKAHLTGKNQTISSECMPSANGFTFRLEDYSCIQTRNIAGENFPTEQMLSEIKAPMKTAVLIAVYLRGPYIYGLWCEKENIIQYQLNKYLIYKTHLGANIISIHDTDGCLLWAYVAM